jgi:hypothetical protein
MRELFAALMPYQADCERLIQQSLATMARSTIRIFSHDTRANSRDKMRTTTPERPLASIDDRTEAGNDPKVSALVYIAAFALDDGESCASIEQQLPQASKAFKPDSSGNWWIDQAHFAADFAADVPPAVSHFMAVSQPISTNSFTPTRSRRPPGRPSPPGARRPPQTRSINPDGEARPCQDDRSECQPCGLHVSTARNSQAHRRGCHLRTHQSVAIHSRSEFLRSGYVDCKVVISTAPNSTLLK